MTLHVTEVLGRCNTTVTPPGGVQLENAICTAAIRIAVHEVGVKATFIVCHAQHWGREGGGSRWAWVLGIGERVG